jgi:hypothetical protein
MLNRFECEVLLFLSREETGCRFGPELCFFWEGFFLDWFFSATRAPCLAVDGACVGVQESFSFIFWFSGMKTFWREYWLAWCADRGVCQSSRGSSAACEGFLGLLIPWIFRVSSATREVTDLRVFRVLAGSSRFSLLCASNGDVRCLRFSGRLSLRPAEGFVSESCL